MKLKGKYLYGCLAAGLLFSLPLLTEAKIKLNGTSFNGVALNGVSLNGTNLNTNQTTPATTQGIVRVEGGQLLIQTTPIAQ